MLIFGWRTRPSVEATGSFDCPVCKSVQPCAMTSQRTWFTLFFVPIFPVSQPSRQLACRTCGSILDPSVMQEIPVAQLADSASASTSTSTSTSAIPNLTIDRREAPTLSVVSLVLGILSPFLIIACFSSLVTSLIAIVTGHIALMTIKRSTVPQRGRAMAIVGASLGYFVFVMTSVLLIYFVNLDWDRPAPNRAGNVVAGSASDRLFDAESLIRGGGNGAVAKGNTPAAVEIAKRFSKALKNASDDAFTGGRERILDLTGGEFLTYCELHEDSCALLVHVPQYKDYQGEVRDALSALAWTIAVSTTGEHLDPGDRLAVAMKGTLLYGDILVGAQPENDSNEIGELGEKEDLYAFFPAPLARLPSAAVAVAEPAVEPETTSPFAQVAPEIDPQPDTREPLLEAASEDAVAPAAVPQARIAENPDPTSPNSGRPAPGNALAEMPRPPTRLSRPDEDAVRNRVPEQPKFQNQIPVRLVKSLEAPGWTIHAMKFVHNDQWLAAGRIDATISLFDTTSGSVLSVSERFDQLSGIASLDASRDGNQLLVGGQNGQTAVMRIEPSGQLANMQLLYRHSRGDSLVQASPSYDFMISGGHDGTVAWQPFDGRNASPRILQEFDKPVLAGYLPSQGGRIQGDRAMVTDGKRLLTFSLTTGQASANIELSSRSARAAAISADGQAVAVSTGREVIEYSTEDGKPLNSYQHRDAGSHWSVAFHPEQPWLLTGGRGVVTVWDRSTAERIAVLDTDTVSYLKTMRFSSDARRVAIVPASAGKAIQIFQLGD